MVDAAAQLLENDSTEAERSLANRAKLASFAKLGRAKPTHTGEKPVEHSAQISKNFA